VQWKLAVYHMYEERRAILRQKTEAAGGSMAAESPHRARALQFPSWLTNTIKCGEARFQRLEFLISVGVFDKKAYTILREPDARFLPRHPDFMTFLQWPGPKAVGARGSSALSADSEGEVESEGLSSTAEQPDVQQAGADVQHAV
jgi:hypothetical protein